MIDQIIRIQCAKLGLPELLVMALARVESTLVAWAWNPEPAYPYLVIWSNGLPFRKLTPEERISEKPPADFPCPPGADRDAEWWGQQASWGPMQIMGAAARERGFRGVFLPELCDPEVGIEYGCKHLKWWAGRFLDTHGWAGVLSAWNTGSPTAGEAYVEKVKKELAMLGGSL